MRMLGGKVRVHDTRSAKPAPKTADPFYLSREWRSFVAALIEARFGSRAKARCEDKACRTPGRRGIRLFPDHVRERRDGGAPFDPRNILFRCGSCHTRKTLAERERRNVHGG